MAEDDRNGHDYRQSQSLKMKKLLFTAAFLTVLLPGLVSAQVVRTPSSVRKAPHALGALKAPEIRLKDNSALSVEQLVP